MTVGKEWGSVSWWGWSQAHKGGGPGSHIDLGPLAVRKLKRLWLWRIVATLIAP